MFSKKVGLIGVAGLLTIGLEDWKRFATKKVGKQVVGWEIYWVVLDVKT